MKKPLLQVALDHSDLEAAMKAADVLKSEVDVLEAGTILCYATGVQAVERLSKQYPDHIILADLKVADAGEVVAKLVFSKGPTWMTVICNAPLATMEAALAVAKQHNGDIQIELYGNWTFEEAKQWKALGLRQLVYHRGRDAELAGQKWVQGDLDKIKRLCDMGFEVSVTGGLKPDDLPFFRGLSVKAIIVGRSLYGATSPIDAARRFKTAIDDVWG